MSYLVNNICEFELINWTYNDKKKDIVSMSLFKLKDGYNSFSYYMLRLEKTCEVIRSTMPNTTIRIFIDHHVYNDKETMQALLNLKIDIILFKCINFIRDEYHIGLFGTLVRFFPFFDFDFNDAKRVFIRDVDETEESLK